VNHPNTLVSQEGVAFVEGEPEINVAAKKWDPALQVPVAVAQTVARASVLNFRANGIVFNPINRKLYELDRDLQTDPDAVTGVEFDTHAYVVDLLGGQKMPFSSPEKEYFFPAEILVMDSSGSLRVRNASEDKRAYRHCLFEPDEALSDVEPKKPAPAKEEESDMPGGGRGRGR
jgi:hypothetical protein